MSGAADNQPLRRRDFLTKLAIGSAGFSGLVALIGSIRLALPRVFSTGGIVRIGRAVDFPLGVATFVAEGESFVFRDRGGIRVLSGTCPHLGCIVRRTDTGFRCPCHGSEFGPAGEHHSGPAPGALKRLSVRLSHDDRLEIDLTRTVSRDDPPLFIPPRRQ